MRKTYGVALLLLVLVLLATVFCPSAQAWLINRPAIKEFALPLAALIFATGQLLLAEKAHEFERQKHAQQRKDQYWDKRFQFFERFRETIGMILEFAPEDAKAVLDGSTEFRKTNAGKIYRDIRDLKFEGEVLFDESVSRKLDAILENFKVIQKKNGEIAYESSSDTQRRFEAVKNAQIEITKATAMIISAFDECKTIITAHLGQNVGIMFPDSKSSAEKTA